SHVAVENAL
nr:Chain C, Peptide from ATP-dependent RNA helicase DDX3X [Homo sapiens]4O2E_F Chain F, Peptide from ATP-dependent RNA helicase DDX3X [Homo sapiens]